MPPVHAKNHNGWNQLKKNLDASISTTAIYFSKREVWYCSIGHNIGFEEDGKGTQYSRPVVIVKKFNRDMFIGIPLTSKIKAEKYYFGIGTIKGKASMAILSQIKLFSSKRLINKVDTVPAPVFIALKKAAKNYIF